MSWVATAVIAVTSIGSTVIQQRANKKAAKRAKQDALDAEKQARKAEVFAETEGEGIGQLAQISLEVDDDELDEETTSNTVRI
jgi:hypothetical protein